jgi:hypothetical protein
MAKEYQVKISIDSAGAISSIDGVTKALDKTGEAADNTEKQINDLAKSLRTLDPKTKQWQELAKQYSDLGGNAKVLNGGLKDLKNTLSTTDPNTEEWKQLNATYIELGGSVSELTGARLKNLKEQLDGLAPDSEQYKKVADEFTNLGGKIDPVVQPVKTLRQQIKELQNELLSGKIPQGSQQFNDMSKELAELKDKAKDFNEEVGARAGSSLEQTSGGLALMKERLTNLDFEGFTQATKGLSVSIKSVGWKEFTGGIKDSAKAFWGLATAIMSNPVVLILTAIALAGTAIYMAFKVAEKNVQESTDRMLKMIDVNAEARKRDEKIALADAQGNAQKVYEARVSANRKEQEDNARKILAIFDQEKNGTKMTEDQFKQLTDARKRKADLEVEMELLKIERINALNQAAFDLERKFNQVGLTARQKASDDLKNSFDDQEKKLIELGATQEMLGQLNAVRNEEERKLNAQFAKEDADKGKAAKEKKKADAKEIADALKAAKETQMMDEIAMEEDLTERIRKAKMSDKDIRIEAVRDEYFTLIENAKTLGMDYVALETELQKKITEIQQEGEKERIEAKKAKDKELADEKKEALKIASDAGKSEYELKLQQLDEQFKLEKAMIEKHGGDVTALTKKYEEERTLIELEERQRRVDQQVEWATMGINLLTSLSELGENKSEAGRKKAFKRNKALQIAQATADTYASANKAYLSQLSVPTPDAPVRGAIAAGVAVVAGLANVAKIAKTQYDGGSSTTPSGGGGGGGGSMGSGGGETTGTTNSSAQFNPLVTNFINNRPDQITPAYVLAGDVASATEARDKVENLARIK